MRLRPTHQRCMPWPTARRRKPTTATSSTSRAAKSEECRGRASVQQQRSSRVTPGPARCHARLCWQRINRPCCWVVRARAAGRRLSRYAASNPKPVAQEAMRQSPLRKRCCTRDGLRRARPPVTGVVETAHERGRAPKLKAEGVR
jgi:hypothetical protein